MAVVELSAGIMSGLPARVIFPGTSLVSTVSGTSGNYYNWVPLLPYAFEAVGGGGGLSYRYTGMITIYQGVVPANFSTLTAYNSRSADALISYNSITAGVFNTTINVSTNPILISSSYVNASASGTATWFRWYVYAGSIESYFLQHQIIGTVGATGSGADLEISDTNIVSGRAYRIQTLRIQFPSSFTYT